MAVSEQTPYIEYTANGTTTSFALNFDCNNQDHLIVLVDDLEPVVSMWSLSNGAVVFNTAPENGKKITLQRNTPFSRTTDYQSYNNSFRPPAVNNDFDRVWYKIQELGVKDWLLNLKIQKFRDDVNLTALENTLEEARQIRDDTANSVVEVKSNVTQSQTLLGDTTIQANLAQGYASSANSANAAAQQAVVDVSTAEADVYSALSAQQTAVNNSLTAIAGGHKAYQTLAAAQAAQASLPVNSIVEVTNDGANNGTYQWNGTALTKSDYDPLTQAKNYADSLKTLLDSDISENRDSISSLLVSLHQVIEVIESESDDVNARVDAVNDIVSAILSSNVIFEDDLTHHLVAIHQLVKNVAEVSSSNGIANARGVFKYGNNYAANEVFTHASGTYLVLEPVTNAQVTPDQDARYIRISESDEATKIAEMSVKSVSITTGHSSSEVPHTISPDGMTMWTTYTMGKLLESKDFGKTWNQIHDFGDLHRVVWVRQTDNNELLLRIETYVYGSGGVMIDVRQRIMRSVGYGTLSMTFETCIDIQNRRNVLFHNGWSISTHKNIILIAEYGAKGDEPWGGQTLPAELSARYAYMSLDYGVTWTTIFDAMDHIADTNGVHLHGICYDPYWERIWINCGDRVSGLWYSDDLGATWTESEYFERDSGGVAPANKRQNVGIIALPTCILFGTDYAQDGVHRIDRAHGKHIAGGKYPVDVAHAIDFGQGHTRAQVCHIINHTYQKENAPIIFGFCSETPVAGTAPAGTVVVTYDGWNFKQIWQDELWQPSGKGLQSLAGITLLNEIIIKSVDSRSPAASTYTKITLKV